MDEGLVALLQIIALLVFAGFCIRMVVRIFRKNKLPALQKEQFAPQLLPKAEVLEAELVPTPRTTNLSQSVTAGVAGKGIGVVTPEGFERVSEEVTVGYAFSASVTVTDPGEYFFQSHYSVTTPLEALQMDGERLLDYWENRPEIEGGRWVMKHQKNYGRWCDIDDKLAQDEQAMIGFKSFLIALRGAFEGDGTYAEKLERMKALKNNPAYLDWYGKTERYHGYKSDKFPELVVWRDFARQLDCNAPQAASLLGAGYETLESVANADIEAIKKLPKFGPKSAPVTINAARRKLGLPPLPL